MEEAVELDIFDYYAIMDRSSIVLMNFSDIQELASGSTELATEAEAVYEALMSFYQHSGEVFDKKMDELSKEE